MIYFASRTGNVRYILNKINLPAKALDQNEIVNEKFILFTYTDGLGQVPEQVLNFMKNNSENCVGVIASGNRNFGKNFCKAADVLNGMYGVPILHKIDLRGMNRDYDIIAEAYHKIF